MIAWDRVCQTKENGGLGVRQFGTQNYSMLLKFVHKLHDSFVLPWKTWFLQRHNVLTAAEDDSFIARILREELPRYRSIMKLTLGNGMTTSFWQDVWLLDATLAEAFLAVHSHSVCPNISVHTALSSPLESQLRPRLSCCIEEERTTLMACLEMVWLTHDPDSRSFTHSSSSSFSSRGAYLAMQPESPSGPLGLQVWNTKLPSKIKFFGWLLRHGRLSSRAYLYHRHICTLEESYCEQCPLVSKTDTHVFSDCVAAMAVWHLLGLDPQLDEFRRPWLLGQELHLPLAVNTDVMILVLWHIWKARNGLIFDLMASTAPSILRRVLHDMESWSCRYRKHPHPWQSGQIIYGPECNL